MREHDLQSQCLKILKDKFPDIVAANIHGGGWSAKGFPDLILCIHGRFVAIELKVGKNVLQSDQRIWKKRIEKAGGFHFSPRTLEEFTEIIEVLCRD